MTVSSSNVSLFPKIEVVRKSGNSITLLLHAHVSVVCRLNPGEHTIRFGKLEVAPEAGSDFGNPTGYIGRAWKDRAARVAAEYFRKYPPQQAA